MHLNGGPASAMELSCATQALCSEWMAQNAESLTNKVYAVPVEIDILTPEQEKYLASWDMGT